MNIQSDLIRLAKELEDESCMDYPVKWIADRIRKIVETAGVGECTSVTKR